MSSFGRPVYPKRLTNEAENNQSKHKIRVAGYTKNKKCCTSRFLHDNWPECSRTKPNSLSDTLSQFTQKNPHFGVQRWKMWAYRSHDGDSPSQGGPDEATMCFPYCHTSETPVWFNISMVHVKPLLDRVLGLICSEVWGFNEPMGLLFYPDLLPEPIALGSSQQQLDCNHPAPNPFHYPVDPSCRCLVTVMFITSLNSVPMYVSPQFLPQFVGCLLVVDYICFCLFCCEVKCPFAHTMSPPSAFGFTSMCRR